MKHFVPRSSLAGCVLAACLLLLTACTSSSNDDHPGKSPASTAPSPARTAAGSSELRLTRLAQAALASARVGEMVEAGTERVSDGVHTVPSLRRGTAYRLSLVCVGRGSARLTVSPGRREETVPCDRSVVRQRITAEDEKIDVNGTAGASGMIAWQIDAI
ncbi:hypothetical protein ABZ439_29840 [Streptomyces sp. NPDC005840]|uniref:hypothetical protein n=1 Tax=Streptomyces sp. NPDC005840 TaxID=3157072 RepID=UPI00340C303C